MSRGLPPPPQEPVPPGSFERCWCTGVTRDEVRRAWLHGARSVEALIRATGACTGCRTCRPELECFAAELARRMRATTADEPPAADADSRTVTGSASGRSDAAPP